jgi:PAS domain S-box-containing protein
MPQGVVEFDAGGKVVSLNPAAEEILGRSLTELAAGASYDEKNPPRREDGSPLPFLDRPSEAALRTGRPTPTVTIGMFNPRDGQYRWIDMSARPLFAEGAARPRGAYLFLDDVTEKRRWRETQQQFNETLEQRVAERTAELASANRRLLEENVERKHAEDEIRQSEARFRFLAESSTDMISRLTPEGVYLYVSPACRSLLGSEPEDLIGQSEYDFFHPDDVPAITDSHTAILDTPIARTDTYRHRRKDGEYVWLETTSHAIRDAESGAVVELQASTRDVTQRQRVAEQLRAMTVELVQAEERERRRLAQILHDNLQQLLVAAKILFATLSIEAVRADDRPTMDKIKDHLNKALDASRSLTAELSPPILEGGLPASLRWLAQWVKARLGLEVELQINDRVEASPGARLLLFQAARELLSNVAEHAGVRQAELALEEAGDELLRITVTDHGAGFDPAAPRALGRPTGGFGIASLREKLERIGGSVEIDAAPGKGANITLYAPRQLEPRVEPAPATSVAKPASPAGSTIRAVIVDDHRMVREGFARLLADTPDITVVGQAQDGLQAVEMARKLHPDVMVMDITMPRMNGIEATRIITAEQPQCRVVGLSMYTAAEMEKAMTAAGAVAYLPKDGPPDALIAAIKGGAPRPSPTYAAEVENRNAK